MKQPKIKIFGQVHKVVQIEFNRESGVIDKIVYANGNHIEIVYRSNEMVSKSLTTNFKIQAPTRHPYHGYAHAPDLEK